MRIIPERLLRLLRQLTPPKAARPWIGLVVLIFAGLTLILLGAARPTPPGESIDWTEFTWTQAGRIGDLMVVGGIFGVVTKLLIMTGAFREGLIDAFKTDEFRKAASLAAKQAICGPSDKDPPDPAILAVFANAFHNQTIEEEWLDRRGDLPVLWRRLTRRVYLPHLNVSGRGQADPHVSTLANKIEGAVDELLNYDSNADYHKRGYLRSLERSIDIEWLDPDTKKKICLVERQRYEMCPFDNSEEIRIISTRTQRSDIQFCETIEEFNVKDGNIKQNKKNVNESEGIVNESIEYTLSGAREYRVFKRRNLHWLVDIEPIFEQVSPYVIDGASINIKNNAEGLEVIFNETGGQRLFVKTGGAGDTIKFRQETSWEARSVLLPGQGYLIVFHRRSA